MCVPTGTRTRIAFPFVSVLGCTFTVTCVVDNTRNMCVLYNARFEQDQ